MKRKTIILAVVAALLLAHVPSSSQAQSGIYSGGSWGDMGGSGSGDNVNGGSGTWGSLINSGSGDSGGGNGTWGSFINSGIGDNGGGSGTWGSFINSGIGDNGSGSGTWGLFNHTGIDDNGSGSGTWGNFNNVDPSVGLGSGLALLTMAGMGYACAKRKKARRE